MLAVPQMGLHPDEGAAVGLWLTAEHAMAWWGPKTGPLLGRGLLVAGWAAEGLGLVADS